MLLYLTGVNEYAVSGIVGSKRWRVAYFLNTIQYLFECGVRFLSNLSDRTSADCLRHRQVRNYFLFADDPGLGQIR